MFAVLAVGLVARALLVAEGGLRAGTCAPAEAADAVAAEPAASSTPGAPGTLASATAARFNAGGRKKKRGTSFAEAQSGPEPPAAQAERCTSGVYSDLVVVGRHCIFAKFP